MCFTSSRRDRPVAKGEEEYFERDGEGSYKRHIRWVSTVMNWLWFVLWYVVDGYRFS